MLLLKKIRDNPFKEKTMSNYRDC